jgi:hypothetical protein
MRSFCQIYDLDPTQIHTPEEIGAVKSNAAKIVSRDGQVYHEHLVSQLAFYFLGHHDQALAERCRYAK